MSWMWALYLIIFLFSIYYFGIKIIYPLIVDKKKNGDPKKKNKIERRKDERRF